MIKKYFTIFLIVIAVLWLPAEVLGVRILRGNIQDILVMENGSGPGQMAGYQLSYYNCHPDGFDLDSKENIYLHDYGNKRIQIFSSIGQFLREIKINQLVKNRHGAGCGLDIAADPDGNVYIIDEAKEGDSEYRRVIKFSNKGLVLKIINSPKETQLVFPDGLATDYFGNLYVWEGSKKNGQISVFDKTSKLLTRFSVRGKFIPPEVQVVQKADSLGRIVFLRNDHLCISNIDKIQRSIIVDSVAVPEEILNKKYWMNDFTLIGFDLNFNIYFEEQHLEYRNHTLLNN